MGKLRFNYKSEVLGKYIDITIIYPTDSYQCKATPQLANRARKPLTVITKDIYTLGMKFQTVYLMTPRGGARSVRDARGWR